MKVSAHRAFNLLKELAYERVSCSEAEKRAAQKLLEVAQSTGAQAHIEEFPVACGKVYHGELVVKREKKIIKTWHNGVAPMCHMLT